MDFKFTEEQQMLQTMVRDFLKKEFPLRQVRQIEDIGVKEFLPIYRKMGDLGFLGLTIPEQYGGAGGSWMDNALFNEEAGRALLPTAHISSITLVAHALLTFGNNEQKDKLLPRLIQGEVVITPAWLGVDMNPRSPDIGTAIKKVNNRFVVDGLKHIVNHIDIANYFLVIAGHKGGKMRWGDVALAIVDPAGRGVYQQLHRSQSGEVVADVEFRNVLIEGDSYMAGEWSRWLALIDGAKIALAAYCVGAGEAALAIGIDYAKERIQFNRPIGSFQAIQFKLADAAISIERARSMTYYATWLMDRGQTCTEEAAMAKLLAGRALAHAATTATLVHGAYGFSVEHDIQLYFRHAKCLENLWESVEAQRGIIAALSLA